jgi:hypothetical protein
MQIIISYVNNKFLRLSYVEVVEAERGSLKHCVYLPVKV